MALVARPCLPPECTSPNLDLDLLRLVNSGRVTDLTEDWHGASLVAQWLRILLPMQGTRVQALVQEDPTRRGAAKPVRHNY